MLDIIHPETPPPGIADAAAINNTIDVSNDNVCCPDMNRKPERKQSSPSVLIDALPV
ncbi:MAG TPA: hypothetical protein VM943_05590 [Pyrinomonadaceae bacterium]|nr:hypothetical protein [Pyrinomonadaceae bacterium]